jgi:hypothetical protein
MARAVLIRVAKCRRKVVSWAAGQLGRVPFQQRAGFPLVGVEVVGELPADSDGQPRRHAAAAHLRIHGLDQVAGFHRALVDLPRQLGQQGVFQDALLRVVQ